MRSFDYSKYEKCLWDNEILNYLTQIHEYKGRQLSDEKYIERYGKGRSTFYAKIK